MSRKIEIVSNRYICENIECDLEISETNKFCTIHCKHDNISYNRYTMSFEISCDDCAIKKALISNNAIGETLIKKLNIKEVDEYDK